MYKRQGNSRNPRFGYLSIGKNMVIRSILQTRNTADRMKTGLNEMRIRLDETTHIVRNIYRDPIIVVLQPQPSIPVVSVSKLYIVNLKTICYRTNF